MSSQALNHHLTGSSMSSTAAVQGTESQTQLQTAQEALDRMDFKSAEEICTRALEQKNCTEETDLLLLRSTASQRRGNLKQALEDIERALQLGKKKDECHLRFACLHLSLSLDHLQIYSTEEKVNSSIISASESQHRAARVLEVGAKISKLGKKELKSPFKRISPGLFCKMLSACDASSLANCYAVCSQWRTTIQMNSSCFTCFRMKGREVRISQGLAFWKRHFSKPIQELDLDFNTKFKVNFDYSGLWNLVKSTSRFFLKSLIIRHRGTYIGSQLIPLLTECPRLRTLRVIDLEATEQRSPRMIDLASVPFELETLEWKDSKSHLLASGNLVKQLKKAKSVTLLSEISSNFVVELLSSSPSLEEVTLLGIKRNTLSVQVCYTDMELPNLKFLSLDLVPAQSQGSFWSHLISPKLQSLHLGQASLKALLHFQHGDELVEFKIEKIEECSSIGLERGTEDTISLILKPMIEWTKLERLKLELQVKDFHSFPIYYRFFYTLIQALTPLSKERFREGSNNISSLILPSLSFLRLGSKAHPFAFQSSLDGARNLENGFLALRCLILSRDAAFAGVSKKDIMAFANGFFPNTAQVSRQRPKPSSLGMKAKLSKVEIYFPCNGDKESISYFRGVDVCNCTCWIMGVKVDDDEKPELYSDEEELTMDQKKGNAEV